MSWESNRDKGGVRHPLKRKNTKRKLLDDVLAREPIHSLVGDDDEEVEGDREGEGKDQAGCE